MRCFSYIFICLALLAAPAARAARIAAAELAVVVNDDEPNSVAIAALYRQAHDVPEKNIIHVRIPGSPRRLSEAEFAPLRQQVLSQLAPGIRAVLMVWTAPYAVECNSITSALTLGFDAAQCRAPCGPGKVGPAFDAATAGDANARLSMLMPSGSVEQARALIARGATRYFRPPPASAYYLSTSDRARNVRAPYFPRSGRLPAQELTIRNLSADVLEGAQDVMVYQTGLARVDKLDTLRFLPGALADHLTSAGGDLLGNFQMSSLRWLEAGATASYGSVSEPCNYWQKFPQPTVLLKHYARGDTAVEAYWKSVAWPTQGVFIGDPLAAPYAR
nr:TIGR03790 family protein [uncultured Duganella sp.]